jgi:hypothetical protein
MRSTVGHVNSDGLNLEWDRTVLGKHRCHHVDDDITVVSCGSWMIAYSLVLSVAVVSIKMLVVLPGTIFESANQFIVSEIQRRQLTLRVDDGWHGEDSVLGIVNDRISRSVPDQMQVFAQMSIVLPSAPLPHAERTSKMVINSSAVCSVSRFNGANLICLGSRHMYLFISYVHPLETYLKGPSIVSRS